MYIKIKKVVKLLKDKGVNLEVCSETENVIVCRLNDGFDTKKVRIIDISMARDE